MAEGYKEDVFALHNSDASMPSTDNKFDLGSGALDPEKEDYGSPGIQTQFDANTSFGENDFPRETGSDSLTTDEDLLT